MLTFATPVSAQKDAAEKAKEGGIEHWIEYYKANQPKASSKPAPQSVDGTKPVDRAKSDASLQEKTSAEK